MVAAVIKNFVHSQHMPCFTQTIHFIAKAINNIINKVNKICREIVKWFKNSVIESDKLTKLQINSEVPGRCTEHFFIDKLEFIIL